MRACQVRLFAVRVDGRTMELDRPYVGSLTTLIDVARSAAKSFDNVSGTIAVRATNLETDDPIFSTPTNSRFSRRKFVGA